MKPDDEQVEAICYSIKSIASAITPLSAAAGTDETGGHVESLTEAVMGISAGLVRIADAIQSLADAISDNP